jgi:hypothetical protein
MKLMANVSLPHAVTTCRRPNDDTGRNIVYLAKRG